MDTMKAIAMKESAQANGAARGRVFDWDKAARLIRDAKFDGPVQVAGAGLQGDWEWTGGDIYRDGKPVPADDTYTFLASDWCIPELSLDGDLTDCWIYEDESNGWGSGTYWPESALAILNDEPLTTLHQAIPLVKED